MEELSLGGRMKLYEGNTRFEKGVVAIRVDGKSFHTWTKRARLKRPFDLYMHVAMCRAMKETAKEMQGFRLGYTQSDECTFMLANLEEMAGAWFDYKVQKLASITASMFTIHFNMFIKKFYPESPVAFFDARAFSVPVDDAANVFVWRQQDNDRNWVQAYAASKYPHKLLQGVSNKRALEWLERDGHSTRVLPGWVKYGTFWNGNIVLPYDKYDYEKLNENMRFYERVLNAAH